MQTMTHFSAELQTLTPLHIGTGAELMKDIDFLIEQHGKEAITHRLDVEKLLMELWEDKGGKPPLPSQLLQGLSPEEKAQYYVYTARGAIRATRETSKMRECIKTFDHQAYVPGSSVKGALRTALGWAGWAQHIPHKLAANDLGDKGAKSAGQLIEARIFSNGKNRVNPNYDVMRALNVGDFHLHSIGQGYQVLNLFVAKSREFESPIEIEAVGGDTVFRGRISVDTFLWTQAAEKVLNFGERSHWMNDITDRVNRHSLSVAQGLVKHFESMQQDGAAKVHEFYKELVEFIPTLPAGRCLFCLGWGGGWDSKTFNTHLKADKNFFEREVVERYRLHRAKSPRKTGDPFPRTRRVVVREREKNIRIRDVMGWVVLDLHPVEARQ